MAQLENIKKVQINASDYSDIEALHFIANSNLDTPAQWKSYIDSLVNKGTSIKGPYTELPDISTDQKKKDAYTQYAGDIILISGSDPESGTYVEYVGITGKIGTPTPTEDNAITAWEKIGTTSTDLNEYYKKGVTYAGAALSAGGTTTSTPSTGNVTGSGTYQKAKSATGSTGSTATANTSETSGGTVDFANGNFAGTTATINSSGSYTPTGTISKPNVNLGGLSTITYVTGVNSEKTVSALTGVKSTGSETFVKSYPGATSYLKTTNVTGVSGSTTASKATAGTAITVAKKASTATTVGNANVGTAVTFNAVSGNDDVNATNVASPTVVTIKQVNTVTNGTAASFTQGTKASLSYTARANVMCSPTVNSGILSWGLTTTDDITAWSTNGDDLFTANTPTAVSTTNVTGVVKSNATTPSATAVTASKITTASKSIAPAVASETQIYAVGDTVNITPYTFADVTVPKAAASATAVVTGLTTTAATGMGVLTGLGTASTGTAITGVSSDGTAVVIKSDGLSKATFANYTSAELANAPTFYGTSATISVSASYKPAGSISGTQVLTAHSHTYVSLPAHTHSITTENATVEVTVSLGNHTHTIGNHTHSVYVPQS